MLDSPVEEPTAPEAPAVEQPHPWANIAPSQFRLLRLSALNADSHTGARPLRFVQYGRAERHGNGQSLLRLSVQVPELAQRKAQNCLEVWIDHRNKEVRFGPDTGLRIEPQNRGLGRFLLAQGIAWAQQHCAHYMIEGGALSAKQSPTPAARQLRDHMLQTLGFTLEYSDAQQLKAQYSAPRVGSLNSDWNAQKVQIIEVIEAAQMLEQADRSLLEQAIKLRKVEERMEQFKREDSGLRFTIACLVTFSLFQAGLLIWIATH
ncbi:MULTISPECIES: hypothetical protein [Pseudomonas]|uniref:hypothetical protein n=1 Tax=Pseudomonas TaxID=286 RepID=UPI000C0D29B1|nr:hypothetical protein [Pseudomonadaceae bacterium]HCP54779.1 hypothetical protein [Pseudomonas sp.]